MKRLAMPILFIIASALCFPPAQRKANRLFRERTFVGSFSDKMQFAPFRSGAYRNLPKTERTVLATFAFLLKSLLTKWLLG
ncbi:MAG: hypothetical protein IKS90_02790 [Clostridia bacterium]|nr:hypothetical protein [Clostridia bacterium]